MEYTPPAFANDGEFIDGTYEVAFEAKTGVLLDSIFDPDSENPTQREFDRTFALGEKFLSRFDTAFEKNLIEQVAAEIVEESYEDSHDEPSEDDYAVMERDLVLKSAQFFPDAVMVVYECPNVYPKDEIVAVLNNELDIDEIYLEE